MPTQVTLSVEEGILMVMVAEIYFWEPKMKLSVVRILMVLLIYYMV